MPFPDELRRVYKKQGYHFVGRYGLVKQCHWLKKSLRSGGKEYCYKQRFYGVPSHRCLQVSLFPGCSQRCLYCWRVMPDDLGISWNEMGAKDLDEPESLLDGMIEEQRKMLIGFKGRRDIDPRLLEEAMNPVHFTPSLVGEPLLYGAERLSRLFSYAFKRNFKSVFLVSNGTFPEVLSRLDTEPTQLYISVSAPNEEIYKRVCRPLLPDGWRRLNRSLELLSSFKCPTVLRLTMVKGYNMTDAEGYARLIKKSDPTYVEVKAAMSLGFFLRRLPREAMPRHEHIRSFAEKLADLTGYNIIDEYLHSRVVLLSKLEKPIKLY